MVLSHHMLFIIVLLAFSCSALVRASLKITDTVVSRVSSSGETLSSENLAYPAKLKTEFKITPSDVLSVKFKLQDTSAQTPPSPNQVILVAESLKSQPNGGKHQAVYYPTSSSKGEYSFDLDTSSSSVITLFRKHPGKYSFSIAVGSFPSSSSSNEAAATAEAIYYTIGTLNFDIPAEKKSAGSKKKAEEVFAANEEIRHVFPNEERAVKPVLSIGFTGAVLAPWLLFAASYFKITSSAKSLSISLSFHSLLFVCAISAFMVLYYLYWVNLNIFETLMLWVPLAIVTVFVGHGSLKRVAEERLRKEKGQ
ncbi:Dolichyl-diphosphooligosaccharide--protein glycosyltransferase subunit Swp1 [Paraphysoderma sedebokerense]|nr:Dolichyl-diphosphooligosaccharide--protein glycosyltransferase subunit Swp1 [Paraphysoderma sedebokerense]